MTNGLLLTEKPARRGFLRSLVMAPVAALATHKLILPAQAKIVTPDEAAERLKHHIAGVENAFRDLFPGVPVQIQGNCLDGGHEHYAEKFRTTPSHNRSSYACVTVIAGASETIAGGRA